MMVFILAAGGEAVCLSIKGDRGGAGSMNIWNEAGSARWQAAATAGAGGPRERDGGGHAPCPLIGRGRSGWFLSNHRAGPCPRFPKACARRDSDRK